MISNRLQSLSRKYLPIWLRKPLGTLHGKFMEYLGAPTLGLIFDLSGGLFKASGCRFKIPRDATKLGFRACFLSNVYEIDERILVQKLIRPEDSVLELGACMGIVSCITNKILRDPTRHVVVEANPFCLPSLHRNRTLNECKFLVEHCAVSNQPAITFFLHPKYIVGSNAHLRTANPVSVPGRSLPELAERYGPFTVLIIDIEGSELEALRAHGEKLRQFRLVIIELHDWVIGTAGVEECRRILNVHGFKLIAHSQITEAWARS